MSLEQAVKTYWNLVSLLDNPEKIGSNTVYENYPVKGHAIPMIMVATTQELREIVPDDRYQPVMKKYLGEILWVHARDDVQALLDVYKRQGSIPERAF